MLAARQSRAAPDADQPYLNQPQLAIAHTCQAGVTYSASVSRRAALRSTSVGAPRWTSTVTLP